MFKQSVLILFFVSVAACAAPAKKAEPAPQASPEPFILRGQAPDVLEVRPDGAIILKGKEIARDPEAYVLFQSISSDFRKMSGQLQSCAQALQASEGKNKK